MPPRAPIFEQMPTLQVVRNGGHLFYDTHGRSISESHLQYAAHDLCRHRHLSHGDRAAIMGAIIDATERNTLPGFTRFYSPYSGEHVFWPELIGDIIEMWTMAVNFMDLTDSEDEDDDIMRDIDIWARPYPDNIGVFRLSWDHPMNYSDTVTENTTDSGESTTEN